MLTREFEYRLDEETRSVSGVAVPYGVATNVGRYTETILRDAVVPADPVVILRNHEGGPIGKVIEHEHKDDGWNIKAKFFDTQAGNEAYELAKEGVAKTFSIGFLPVEHVEDKQGNITRSKIDVREVSLIVYPKSPAYAAAAIKEVREEKEMTDITKVDLDEVKDSVDELKREFANLTVVEREPAIDTRSVGEFVKAVVRGDNEAVESYHSMQSRAYAGGTTADTVTKAAWVGDLTRVVEEAAPLTKVFSTGTLPEKGMSIEYAQLKSNTIVVDEQAAQGDTLDFGLVKVETKTAPVKTFGGYTTMSFQEIERSNVNILDTAFKAMGAATGVALNSIVSGAYLTAHAAQVTATNTVSVAAASATYVDWIAAIVDAAIKFETLGMPLEALVVDSATFKELVALTGADGRPLMVVSGSGVNAVGNMNVKGLRGDIANVQIVMSGALSTDKDECAFVNKAGLKLYKSPVVRLQDTNILTLTKDFSVYTLAAIANEVPAAIVPVVRSVA